MKLTKVRIKNFKSIQDSTEFDIDDQITCLVGKNQSGKTAILEALVQFAEETPIYNQAEIIELTYTLEKEDFDIIEKEYGSGSIKSKDTYSSITLKKETSKNKSDTITVSDLNVDMDADKNEVIKTIYEDCISSIIPQFLLTDFYYEIQGKENLSFLNNRIRRHMLQPKDKLLRLLVDDDTLTTILSHKSNDTMMQEKSPIREVIQNRINEVMELWSDYGKEQTEIEIKKRQVDVDFIYDSPPQSPYGHQSPCYWFMHLIVKNIDNRQGVLFDHESHGFRWFFSFLLEYKDLLQGDSNAILLLDEPALPLHGAAQADILRCFETYLTSKHQIIYTTHSPFMIDIDKLDRVRVVENDLDSNTGTSVSSDILHVNEKSILPIQSAVGFNINQLHGKGQNILIVEGESDIVYIDTMLKVLQECENGQNMNWEFRSADGIDKIVSAIGQYRIQEKSIGSNFNIAVLTDYHQKKHQTHENIKSELGKSSDGESMSKFITYKDFVGKEADVEDMFTPEFYVALVCHASNTTLNKTDVLGGKHPRIISNLKEYFENNPSQNNKMFCHGKVAEHFKDNIDLLKDKIDSTTRERFQKLFDTLNGFLES